MRDGKGDERNERDPDVPPTAEEIAEAETLRRALEDPHQASASADFARAVSLAHAPRSMAEEEHRAIVEQAIERGEARRRERRATSVGPRLTRRTVGSLVIAGGLALAAAIALAIGAPFDGAGEPGPAVSSVERLVPVRSTQPLFREPFARSGGASARIDRIASARSADLRDNRFTVWGVK